MKNQLQDRQPSRYFASGVGVRQFFSSYEEAWQFSEVVFAATGRIVTIEPVYSF